MMMAGSVSVVIPVRDDPEGVGGVLDAIIHQSTVPDEIIIVDSSEPFMEVPRCATEILLARGVSTRVIASPIPLMPGAARNLGVEGARGTVVAFLDVKTIPTADWLSEALEILEKAEVWGVWGKTVYEAHTRFERCLRAATYGCDPLVTVPGSVFRRDLIWKVGGFLESLRAGEDADWMLRVRLHGVSVSSASISHIRYTGLLGVRLWSILKKWYRNYAGSRHIPYLRDHRWLYLIAGNAVLVFVAFHWNSLLAGWDEGSPFYFNHVTKITLIGVGGAYALARGVLVPMRRGVEGDWLMPLNWAMVACIGFCLDIVKVLAFIPGWRKLGNPPSKQ